MYRSTAKDELEIELLIGSKYALILRVLSIVRLGLRIVSNVERCWCKMLVQDVRKSVKEFNANF